MALIDVKSDIAGKVWRMDATIGQQVNADDPIVTLESMKMEIPVAAPAAGAVKEILVAEGDTVAEGQIVARLEG